MHVAIYAPLMTGANAMLRHALEADAQFAPPGVVLCTPYIKVPRNSQILFRRYLYFIFVADDARLSEALHRSRLTGESIATYLLALCLCQCSCCRTSLIFRKSISHYGRRALALATSDWVPLP